MAEHCQYGYQIVQFGELNPTIYDLRGLANPVGSWPEVVRFGWDMVKCGIKLLVLMS